MVSTSGDSASFYQEAQFQRVCASCDDPGPFEAHHVVPKQRLKREGKLRLLWDPRNALRLCAGTHGNRCHARYEARNLTIATAKLTPDNICFVWQVLGVAGKNFLERFYTGVDRRYTLHEEGRCPLCQLKPQPH